MSFKDLTSIRNIVNVIPNVVLLYKDFASDNFDAAMITETRELLFDAYSHEALKKPANESVVSQLRELRLLFEEAVADRTTGQRWTQEHLEAKLEEFNSVVDAIIIVLKE